MSLMDYYSLTQLQFLSFTRYYSGAMVQTFDDTAVFAALKCPYVPPKKRLPKP